jgi:hypothetical protein
MGTWRWTQHGVKSTGAQFVAVARKLMDHPLAIKRVFSRMVKDVQTDEAFEQILMLSSASFLLLVGPSGACS